ncbi:MAG: hypothetical protein EHM58_09720 [Ignavibacteriae bacterium]|nr:MAG: hypothetical protein EHM58_09720 [Ignavibacteriota bacterium]
MIKHLQIKNFKSIKELEFDCSRVNLFIGEPNTGKSNILEAIGIFSLPYSKQITDFVRLSKFHNLFYDNDLNNTFQINIEHSDFKRISINPIIHDYKIIQLQCISDSNMKFKYEYDLNNINYISRIDHDLTSINDNPIKFYRFKSLWEFTAIEPVYLKPPFGDNLLEIIKNNLDIDEFSNSIFQNDGYNLYLRSADHQIEIFRSSNEGRSIVSLPYALSSDTFQRMIFNNAILESNKNSSIILEEPEAHVFPYYNKFLAERIANYNTNQFFIATHNPTFLANIVEQTPDEELKVFITYNEDFQTKVFELSGDKLMETYKIYGTNMFGNLDKIVKYLDKIIENEYNNNK